MNALQAGLGKNVIRQVAVYAGILVTSSAFTLNKICGSILKTVAFAANAIIVGESDIVIAGGISHLILCQLHVGKVVLVTYS